MTPTQQRDFQTFVSWAMHLRSHHVPTSTILKYLLSTKKSNDPLISKGLWDMRELYKEQDTNWQDELLRYLVTL